MDLEICVGAAPDHTAARAANADRMKLRADRFENSGALLENLSFIEDRSARAGDRAIVTPKDGELRALEHDCPKTSRAIAAASIRPAASAQ